MNGRGAKGGKQLYYKSYQLIKKDTNYEATAQIGDELKGRGDGTFENGELGHWEVLAYEPIDDTGVERLNSYP